MRRKVLVGVVLLAAAIGAWLLHGDRDSHAPPSERAAGSATLHHGSAFVDASTTLAGRVTRTDGSPLAGAVVAIVHTDLATPRAERSRIVVAADHDGAWISPVVPGTYVVAATAVGFLPQSKPITVAVNAHLSLDLALAPGGVTLRGRVTDIGGGPVASVQIIATTWNWAEEELASITGVDGTYQLTVPAGRYNLVARHDDYTAADLRVDLVDVAVVRDFVLVPTGMIAGVVIARDSRKPVPGALVQGDVRQTTSEPDGTFTLRGLGAVELSATARGYASTKPTVVEVGIGDRVGPVEVVVDHALGITGRVVREGADGIAGVQVVAFSRTTPGETIATTDATGRFELLGVRPASYVLTASREGFVTKRSSEPIKVTDRDVTGVVLELASGVTITGRVDPPQMAEVHLDFLDHDPSTTHVYLGRLHATADMRGAFALHNVPLGRFKLIATTTDGQHGELPIVVAKQDQSSLVVRLEPQLSVSGHVVDARGDPVSGVEVDLISDAGVGGTNITRTDGSFKVVGLDRRKFSVVASQWRSEWSSEGPEVSVDLDDGRDHANLTLTVTRNIGTIQGQVVADGQPQPEVWVTCFADDTNESTKSVLTDASGSFRCDHLRPVTYRISAVTARGNASGLQEGVMVGTSTTITLLALEKVTVHVTAAGAPVTNYHVWGCHGISGMANSPDGTWTFAHVPPGDRDCIFEADEGSATAHIHVPMRKTVEVALTPWGQVTGTVVDAKGSPVTGYFVTASTKSMYYYEYLRATTSTFTFKRIPPGELELVIEDEHHHITRNVTVTGGPIDLGAIKLVDEGGSAAP